MAADAGARLWLTLGAVNGFFSVAMGAFAAHGLKARLSEQMLGVFDKGVDYQGFHALALLAVGLLLLRQPGSRPLRWAAALFLGGTLLFSGSLYLLALSGVRGWGVATPFGGTSFLLGWVMLGIGAWRLDRE